MGKVSAKKGSDTAAGASATGPQSTLQGFKEFQKHGMYASCISLSRCMYIVIHGHMSRVHVCCAHVITGGYDSDTPTGLSDAEDGHTSGKYTKPALVTKDYIAAMKISKKYDVWRRENYKEIMERGACVLLYGWSIDNTVTFKWLHNQRTSNAVYPCYYMKEHTTWQQRGIAMALNYVCRTHRAVTGDTEAGTQRRQVQETDGVSH